MKIYLHRNGKNYGPYSLSVIRDFLKSGKCQENELVCCDGKNWIKLRELPGLAESPSITESKEVRAKMPESEARPKPAKRKTSIIDIADAISNIKWLSGSSSSSSCI